MPYLQLGLWVLGLSGLWLLALPAISRTPRISEELRLLDERGIDPSAMFYTELEIMKPLLHRLERR
jgi:hypothetical protein